MSLRFIIVLLGLMALATQPARAHGTEKHDDGSGFEIGEPVILAPMDPVAEEKARKYFTDLPVITQDGEELRFFSDVLKGRIVVLTMFYTNCTGACPLVNQKLAEVQDMLGDAMGRDFFFVSVTLDPETDTPEVLKKYAANFGAEKGWYFLTGSKENIRTITQRLGQTGDDMQQHATSFMIGNVPRAHWSRLPPNQPAEGIVGRLSLIAGTFVPAATEK